MFARFGVTRSLAMLLASAGLAWQTNLAWSQPATTPPATAPAKDPLADLVPKLIIEDCVTDATDNVKYADIKVAMDLFAKSDFDKARGAFEEAVKKHKVLPPTEILMARMLMAARQPKYARAELEQAAKLKESDPESYLYFAEAAMAESRVTDASALCAVAGSKLAPMATQAEVKTRYTNLSKRYWGTVASVSEARAQWPEAQKQLTNALTLDAKAAQFHQRMGRALFMQKDIAKATESLKKATELEKAAPSHQILLAQLYQSDNQLENAAKAIEAAVAEPVTADTKDRVLKSRLIATQFYVGRNLIKEAEKNADAALVIDPESLDANLTRGIVARMAGDFATAEKKLDGLNSKYPTNFAVSNNLALVLVEMTDTAKKERGMQLASLNFNANKENQQLAVEAAATLGWTLYKTGKSADAEKVFQAVINSNQLNADSAYYISQVLYDQKQYENAGKLIISSLDTPVFFNRGNAEKLQKLIETAKPGAATKPAAGVGTTPPAPTGGK